MQVRFYDLVNAQKDNHLSHTIADLIKNDVLVIINHNDSTSDFELRKVSSKTDNDKNTIHISEVVNTFAEEIGVRIDRVINLTNTDGLLDAGGNTVLGGDISSDGDDREAYLAYATDGKSSNGTGGMRSKVYCAFEVLKHGVKQSIIANAAHGLSCLKDSSRKSTKFTANSK